MTQPAQPLAVTHTQTNVLCYGDATGAIDISVTGGTPAYNYAWNTGITTEDISGLPIGAYSVQITDANGCQVNYSATISQPIAPLSLTGLVTPIPCFGQSNGAVNIAVSGGTTPYTYSWNNGLYTTQNISSLVAGTYQVVASDSNACTISKSFVVTQPQGPLVLSETHTDAGCLGPGTIDLTVSGGSTPYSYFWSNLTANQDITNASAGTYQVNVEDASGCADSLTVQIIDLSVPIVPTLLASNILCLGDSTGSVDLTITGGVAPFEYLWSNGDTTQDVSALPAGSYAVQITDANGCSAEDSVTLTQPLSLMSLSETHTDANCLDTIAGAIDLSVTGGTPGYTYLWNNGAVTQDITGLQNGLYVVTVADANGCEQELPIQILDPSNTVMVSTIVHPVNCFGGADGWIDLSPSGGTPGYVYDWGTGAVVQDIYNLAAGQYYVNVEDVLGCGMFLAFDVTEPDTTLTATSTNYNVVCLGDINGIVDLHVSGGTVPYTYAWNTGETTQDLYNLSAGSYSVIVTDSNNCTAQYTAQVTQPSSLLTMTLFPSSALCFGQPNGGVDLSIAGGVPGYTYSWSN